LSTLGKKDSVYTTYTHTNTNLQHNLGLGARRANEVRRLFDDVVLRERGGLSKERGGKREKGRESVLCVKSA